MTIARVFIPPLAAALLAGLSVAQGRVDGEVVDEKGLPIAGACVRMGAASLTVDEVVATPDAKTGADGRFSLGYPDSGDARLHVVARGRVAWSKALTNDGSEAAMPIVFGDEGRGRPSRVLITLERGWTAVGRVRDGDGRPVAGATVRFSDLLDEGGFGWYGRTHLSGSVRTDASGIFRLPGLPRAGARVRVTRPGYAGVTLAPVAMGTPMDVALDALPSIRGVLRDDGGRPAAGRLRVEHFEDVGDWVEVDGDGAFELERLAHGNARVTARTEDGREGIAFVGLSETGLLQIKLDAPPVPGPRIELVDAAEQVVPIQRAQFAWADLETPASFFDELAPFDLETDEKGAWRLPSATMELSTGYLRVAAKGVATKIVEVSLEVDGDKVFRVQSGAAGRVEGRVRVRDGDVPVAGASVWAIPRDGRRDALEHDSVPKDAVTTDADGAFSIEGLAPGRYLVISERAGSIGRPRPVRVREGGVAETVLSVPAIVEVAGKVKGAEDRRLRVLIDRAPHPDLLTGVISFAGMQMVHVEPGIRPDAGGVVRLTTTAVGKLGVGFSLPGSRVGPPRVSPLFAFFNTSDESFAADGSLVRPGRVHGRISVASAKLPLERLAVLVQPVAQEWLVFDVGLDLSGYRAVPAPDGTFDLPLFAGDYRLLVVDMVTGLVFHRQSAFPLVAGEVRKFDLTIEAGELEIVLAGDPARLEGVMGIQCTKVEEREDDTVGIGFALMHDEWPGCLIPRNRGVRTLRIPVPPGTMRVRAVTRGGSLVPMPFAVVAGEEDEEPAETDVDVGQRVRVELRPGG